MVNYTPTSCKFNELDYKLLPHLQYSPKLNLNDYNPLDLKKIGSEERDLSSTISPSLKHAPVLKN